MITSSNSFEDNFWNKLLIIIITLCALSFFLIKGIGKGDRVLEISGAVLILFFIILFSVYSKNKPAKSRFSILFSVMLLGILISTIACSYFHDQALSVTFYQQRQTYYLLFYFLLPFLFPNAKWVENYFFYFGIFGAAIYIMQHTVYPVKITEAKMFIDRNTLRINLPGITFMNLAFFLCIDKYFRTAEKKYAIGVLILLATAILSAFRSVLAAYIGLAAVYLIINKHVKNKVLIIFTSCVVAISAYFVFQNIIDEMQTSAKRETSLGSDYIRVRAGNYFLDEMVKDKVIFFTGNGQPSERSDYGSKLIGISLFYGYYLSDVGIIGSYYKFGLLFVLASVAAMIFLLFTKLPVELQYIKLFIIMQFLLILMSSFPFEGSEGAIILCLIFYLVDKYKNEQEELTTSNKLLNEIK
jgi:hypothetical protein